MQLLSVNDFKNNADKERDAELKESYLRRKKILEEIKMFNQQKDTLEKGMKLLEQEFETRCFEMLETEKRLQKEIKELKLIKNNHYV